MCRRNEGLCLRHRGLTLTSQQQLRFLMWASESRWKGLLQMHNIDEAEALEAAHQEAAEHAAAELAAAAARAQVVPDGCNLGSHHANVVAHLVVAMAMRSAQVLFRVLYF
jgi:hypothetical protein